MEKLLFDITGMSCSACSARIEKVLSKLEGIEEVSVNLLTNSMSVTFDAQQINANQIVKKVESVGYGASPKIAAAKVQAEKQLGNAAQSETRCMRNRLIVSLVFTIPLFYISMGEMLGWPLPGFLSGMENAMAYAFTLFLLTLPVMYAGRTYFTNGFKNLVRLSPNMDSLIAIGAGAACLDGIFLSG